MARKVPGLPRRARHAKAGLVNVGGTRGRRLVVAREAIDGDVVADDVLVCVNAEVEHASATLEATSELVLGVYHLVGAGNDIVGGGELEGTIHVLIVALVGAGHGRGGGEGREGENGDGLHGDWLGAVSALEENGKWVGVVEERRDSVGVTHRIVGLLYRPPRHASCFPDSCPALRVCPKAFSSGRRLSNNISNTEAKRQPKTLERKLWTFGAHKHGSRGAGTGSEMDTSEALEANLAWDQRAFAGRSRWIGN